MIIKSKAYARAALIGNPSDGYYGKTISFTFDNFAATVTLYESPELEILPTRRDGSVFTSLDDLARDVQLFGYYGGIRLLKAGYYNLCLSHPVLYHHESKTRGPEDTVEKQIRFRGEIDLMEARWGELLKNDPFYSPHLTRYREDYSISLASYRRFPRWPADR